MENDRTLEEVESISASIDESYADDNYDDKYICIYDLEDIRDVSYVYPNINVRDTKLKIYYLNRQFQNKWKGLELSAKSIGRVLHKLFKAIVNELDNSLPTLVESDSEVSYFIPERSNFTKVTRLLPEVKNGWLKSTFMKIGNLINNQTFIME